MKLLEEDEEASSTSHAQSSSKPHSIASLSHRDFVQKSATINTSTSAQPGQKQGSATHLMLCVNCDRPLNKTQMLWHKRVCKTREGRREFERTRQLAASSEHHPCNVAGCVWTHSVISTKSSAEKTPAQLRSMLMTRKRKKHKVTKDIDDTASDLAAAKGNEPGDSHIPSEFPSTPGPNTSILETIT